MTELTTLRGMLHFVSEFVQLRFDATGHVWAMWHAVEESGQHFVLPAPVGATKDQAAAMVREEFKRRRVIRYVFVDEAWTIDAGTDYQAALETYSAWIAEHGSLADHPKRREIVTFSCEDHQTGVLAAEREIIRKVNSRARLGPLQIMDARQSEGRFVGMLPKEPQGSVH